MKWVEFLNAVIGALQSATYLNSSDFILKAGKSYFINDTYYNKYAKKAEKKQLEGHTAKEKESIAVCTNKYSNDANFEPYSKVKRVIMKADLLQDEATKREWNQMSNSKKKR